MIAIAKLGPHDHWLALPYLPLATAMHAREAYKRAEDMVKALVDIHYGALKLRRSEGKLFALANALELVRAVLPGRSDSAKQQSLRPEVTANLRQSLHWLFNIANNRFNVRHVLTKAAGKSALHPRLNYRAARLRARCRRNYSRCRLQQFCNAASFVL